MDITKVTHSRVNRNYRKRKKKDIKVGSRDSETYGMIANGLMPRLIINESQKKSRVKNVAGKIL